MEEGIERKEETYSLYDLGKAMLRPDSLEPCMQNISQGYEVIKKAVELLEGDESLFIPKLQSFIEENNYKSLSQLILYIPSDYVSSDLAELNPDNVHKAWNRILLHISQQFQRSFDHAIAIRPAQDKNGKIVDSLDANLVLATHMSSPLGNIISDPTAKLFSQDAQGQLQDPKAIQASSIHKLTPRNIQEVDAYVNQKILALPLDELLLHPEYIYLLDANFFESKEFRQSKKIQQFVFNAFSSFIIGAFVGGRTFAKIMTSPNTRKGWKKYLASKQKEWHENENFKAAVEYYWAVNGGVPSEIIPDAPRSKNRAHQGGKRRKKGGAPNQDGPGHSPDNEKGGEDGDQGEGAEKITYPIVIEPQFAMPTESGVCFDIGDTEWPEGATLVMQEARMGGGKRNLKITARDAKNGQTSMHKMKFGPGDALKVPSELGIKQAAFYFTDTPGREMSPNIFDIPKWEAPADIDDTNEGDNGESDQSSDTEGGPADDKSSGDTIETKEPVKIDWPLLETEVQIALLDHDAPLEDLGEELYRLDFECNFEAVPEELTAPKNEIILRVEPGKAVKIVSFCGQENYQFHEPELRDHLLGRGLRRIKRMQRSELQTGAREGIKIAKPFDKHFQAMREVPTTDLIKTTSVKGRDITYGNWQVITPKSKTEIENLLEGSGLDIEFKIHPAIPNLLEKITITTDGANFSFDLSTTNIERIDSLVPLENTQTPQGQKVCEVVSRILGYLAFQKLSETEKKKYEKQAQNTRRDKVAAIRKLDQGTAEVRDTNFGKIRDKSYGWDHFFETEEAVLRARSNTAFYDINSTSFKFEVDEYSALREVCAKHPNFKKYLIKRVLLGLVSDFNKRNPQNALKVENKHKKTALDHPEAIAIVKDAIAQIHGKSLDELILAEGGLGKYQNTKGWMDREMTDGDQNTNFWDVIFSRWEAAKIPIRMRPASGFKISELDKFRSTLVKTEA